MSCRNPLTPLRVPTLHLNNNDENLPPAIENRQQQPLTPMQTALNNIRKRLERQMTVNDGTDAGVGDVIESRVSPGLAQLRNTPGSRLKEKQKILTQKHQEAKGKLDAVNVGGGISLWPEMENMRLTKQEVVNLMAVCLLLLLATISLFQWLHGELLGNLTSYTNKLSKFSSFHRIEFDSQRSFDRSVLNWHSQYKQLLSEVDVVFHINIEESPLSYKLCIVCYTLGLAILLYYLMDNMFAQTKLTPRRIKNWVSLLVIVSSWTMCILVLLVSALHLEKQVEKNVHNFSDIQGDLVTMEFCTRKYEQVLSYWRVRALPPTCTGTLHIMGLIAVQDVSYYLQYYSVTVFTAIGTPVIKLCISLREIYAVKSFDS
ncbi:uncharacterized protein LOC141913154 [Tubulanus polymorphus]|uniref:uncharacterized protein LOC141913154 n=1 Tax=Tubulanus polymorphus TaxID=672921 RepID=UPI003DA36CEF